MFHNKLLPKLAVGCCLAALSFGILGCGGAKPAEPKATAPKELKITYVKSPLNIPSIIDKNLQTVSKEFAKTDTKVSFPEINSGAKQTEALAAGSLDICSALGGTSAILAASNGVDLKIVGIYSRAPKAFNIMAKDPSIKTAADLAGKKVAGPKGTILHQILIAALAKDGLKPDAVELLSMDIPPSVNAMLNGNVDAALVAGSDVLRAQKAGAHIITSGEGLVDATIVIAARGDLVKNNPDIIKRYLAAHKENIAYLAKEQSKAYDFTAQATGLTPDDVAVMAPWYDFDPEIKTADIKDLNDTQDFLLATGLQKNKIDLAPYIAKI
ncbi:NrtA/SsuA/CpmA family ABC transporter substrate-binding protein [uncultured Phascolarctobacterium sp.]|uniref:NrtA/SsuA/CpmA family ABC transporter substrate-binding protein n=1 Tax=Phascolarctobacterium sp. TaxID=2049039 RepID=UPI0025CF7DB9|nr:NrtA/SsuA/CpmA family ABC transporter substrate-binding protein [uncultured Phascolarctobacterium sp.]